MMRTYFSSQLMSSHYPGRKQKNILIQKEPDYEKVENYKQMIDEYEAE